MKLLSKVNVILYARQAEDSDIKFSTEDPRFSFDYYSTVIVSYTINMIDKVLLKKALLLEYLTIAWNIFEGIASMSVGMMSGSVALFAYGLESAVEVFASSVVVWELKGKENTKRRQLALKLIGLAYLVVSAYVFIDASYSLFEGQHPERSLLGIVLMAVSATIMAILGLSKSLVGKKMESETVLADAKFTLIDGALSSTILVGLLFNAVFGWWWMDQALALFLAGAAFREGVKELF